MKKNSSKIYSPCRKCGKSTREIGGAEGLNDLAGDKAAVCLLAVASDGSINDSSKKKEAVLNSVLGFCNMVLSKEALQESSLQFKCSKSNLLLPCWSIQDTSKEKIEVYVE